MSGIHSYNRKGGEISKMAKDEAETVERSPEELSSEDMQGLEAVPDVGDGMPEDDYRRRRSSFDLRSTTFSLGVIFRGSEKDLKDIMLMMEKQGMKFAYTTGLRASKLRIVNYNPEYHSRQYRQYDRRDERGSRQEYADQQQRQSERS